MASSDSTEEKDNLSSLHLIYKITYIVTFLFSLIYEEEYSHDVL